MSQVASVNHDTLSEGSTFKALSRHDVAEILGVSVRTVENWRREQRIPPSAEIGGRVYWHSVVFYEWLDVKLRGSDVTVTPGKLVSQKTTQPPVNRASESTGALERARRRSADAIAAMTK